ncbi:unnamed protein product [Blepharisma stoltei]|uniref:PIN-like protein n=1 Tax=Blepharisma stoltei TaxID=1481888 RepID=A0AAU9IHE4_9CILI|nr:unnamed protein product [Blepharisma stoltei]
MDILQIFRSCVTGMIPVTIITISGAYLTWAKVFEKKSNEVISKSSARFFFPLFIVIAMSKAVDTSTIVSLWPLFVGQVLLIFITIGLGFLMLPIFKVPKEFKYTTISILAFSNVGNVPLLVMKGICASYGPFAGDDYCDNSVGYISIVCFVFNIMIWSICTAFVRIDSSERAKNENSENNPNSTDLKKLIINGLLSPVPIASVLGLLIGLLPGYKWLFVYKSSPLYAFFDTLSVIGYVGIVASQMVVGSNLMMIERKEKFLDTHFLWTLTFTKSVVLSGIYLFIVWGFWEIGVFGDNKVMAYVLFIAQTSPVSVTVMIVCQLFNTNLKECCITTLWQYIAAPVYMTLYSYAFFLII